ncbi:hypothetical protein BD311DRAFT_748004 [Dichomitus squalens]|uniref:Uncharacterized protein n=1 Tax=Dichomitus squalens TaxID=114155 RepID=A0A4Q9N451_9APHY|nr:hypothetical protein BD311DRAFT_748004 [Dichomitus squalens]
MPMLPKRTIRGLPSLFLGDALTHALIHVHTTTEKVWQCPRPSGIIGPAVYPSSALLLSYFSCAGERHLERCRYLTIFGPHDLRLEGGQRDLLLFLRRLSREASVLGSAQISVARSIAWNGIFRSP